jgi:hypothetical protein
VSRARTRVGIVEWSARTRAAHAVELRVADALGALVGGVPDASAKLALARVARHHGFHAELWVSVVPVLHDVDPAAAVTPGGPLAAVDAALAAPPAAGTTPLAQLTGEVLPALAAVYREWCAEATPFADAPVVRVLELVLADDDRDLPDLEVLGGTA